LATAATASMSASISRATSGSVVSFAGATTSGSTTMSNAAHSPTGGGSSRGGMSATVGSSSSIPLFSSSSDEITHHDNDDDDDDDRSLFGVTQDRGSGTVTAKAVSATDYEAEIRRRLQQEAVIAFDVINEDEQMRSFSKNGVSYELDDDERKKKRKLCLTYGGIGGAIVIILIIALVVTATILKNTKNINMFSGGSYNNNSNNNQVPPPPPTPTVSPVNDDNDIILDNNNDENNNNDQLIPTPPPPSAPPINNNNDWMDSDMAIYFRQVIAEVLPKDSLVDTLGSVDSPQYLAFMFVIANSGKLLPNVMSASDPLTEYEKSKCITIFSLVSLYHSTDGPNWFINNNWLNPDVDMCEWHGINCKGELREDLTMNVFNDKGDTAVTSIDLRGDDGGRSLRRRMLRRELQTGAPEVIYDTPLTTDDGFDYGDPLGNGADDDTAITQDDLAGDDLVYNEETGQWEGIDYPDDNEEVVQEEEEEVVQDNGDDDTLLVKEDDNFVSRPTFDDDQTWFVDDAVLDQGNDDEYYQDTIPIRSINLMANNLVGEIPNELGLLTNVYELINFDTNNLEGSIPSSLSMLSKLQGINFSYNNLESTIPTELGSMTEIRIFDISNNKSIQGTFPTELNQWMNIGTYHIFVSMVSMTMTVVFLLKITPKNKAARH
jgi:hypothetical protein